MYLNSVLMVAKDKERKTGYGYSEDEICMAAALYKIISEQGGKKDGKKKN